MCCRAEKRVGSECPPYGEQCLLLLEGSLKMRGQQTMLFVSVAVHRLDRSDKKSIGKNPMLCVFQAACF